MSNESRKDENLELATQSAAIGNINAEDANNISAGKSQTGDMTDPEEDEVLELGEHHIVETPMVDSAASVSSQPPPFAPNATQARPDVKNIPMARISMRPPAPPAAAQPEDAQQGALFELQEDHVVEAGKPFAVDDNAPVDHAFDFGTPEMVFDNTAPVENAADADEQPKFAVPFNQPATTASQSVSDSIPGATDSQPAPRISVHDRAAAVFDDVLPDGPPDAPRESTLDNFVGYMNQSTQDTPSMNAPEAVFSGVPTLPQSDPPAGSQTAEEEDLDIDITEEVEEVTDDKGEPIKPPPPPVGATRPVNSFFKNDKIDAQNASLKLLAKTARKSRGKKREWWASIFDDEYLMLLPERSPYEQQKQIDFIQHYLGLPPGALLLDLACGNGRNSIGMAQRNYRIVGVDLSLSMLARAGDAAQDAGQKINFIHGDMRDLGFDKTFDGVFSLDTSFGYFDEPTNVKVLQGIYRALKPGGTFLLELANRDFVIRQQPNMVWFQMDNMVCMEETDFNYINNRLYISRQLIIGDNQKQSKHEFSLRLYSLHEIGQMLHQAGFAVIKVSGHRATPGAFFGPESSKLIIIAERRGE